MFSNQTIYNIASAMTDDAIEFIEKDERYADFMIEMLTEYVSENLKTKDNELICELGCALMDRIYLKSMK
jgi:hypothetical protein